jgi:hypothetical protein
LSRTPEGFQDKDPEINVVARRVLLDGLDALSDHAEAVTIVGAQAIYLHTANVELAVASYTSDADLGLYPDDLNTVPLIQDAMQKAGFELVNVPGSWAKTLRVGASVAEIHVDLLVGEGFGGRPGRRSPKIKPHDGKAARQVPGLEPAAVDFERMDVGSLEVEDTRVITARVAGPAALLVAKAIKISERAGERVQNRLNDKDAGDVIRLMQGIDEDDVADRFDRLLRDVRVAGVTATGLRALHDLFGGERTAGTLMAASALAGDPIAERVGLLAPTYLAALPKPEAG